MFIRFRNVSSNIEEILFYCIWFDWIWLLEREQRGVRTLWSSASRDIFNKVFQIVSQISRYIPSVYENMKLTAWRLQTHKVIQTKYLFLPIWKLNFDVEWGVLLWKKTTIAIWLPGELAKNSL